MIAGIGHKSHLSLFNWHKLCPCMYLSRHQGKSCNDYVLHMLHTGTDHNKIRLPVSFYSVECEYWYTRPNREGSFWCSICLWNWEERLLCCLRYHSSILSFHTSFSVEGNESIQELIQLILRIYNLSLWDEYMVGLKASTWKYKVL